MAKRGTLTYSARLTGRPFFQNSRAATEATYRESSVLIFNVKSTQNVNAPAPMLFLANLAQELTDEKGTVKFQKCGCLALSECV